VSAFYHGDRALLGELLYQRLSVRAQYDRVCIPRHHPGGVAHALAARERAIGTGHDERVGTETSTCDLERHAGTHGWLLQHDRHGFAGERRGALACRPDPFLRCRNINDMNELGRSQIREREQITPSECVVVH
jgi:hypothetical protein